MLVNLFRSFFGGNCHVGTPERIIPGTCSRVINGQLKLQGQPGIRQNIVDSMQINGQLVAQHTVFQRTIEVNGQAVCTDCNFKGDLLIRGDPKMDSCVFEKVTEVVAKYIMFKNCKGKKLVATNPTPHTGHRKTEITLENSQFESVEFLGSEGRVFLCPNSVVDEVINGVVQNH